MVQMSNSPLLKIELDGGQPLYRLVKDEHYKAQDFRELNYTANRLIKEGNANLYDLCRMGFTFKEILQTKYRLRDMVAVGVTAESFRRAKITVKMLHDDGAKVELMYRIGFTIEELKEGGYSLFDIDYVLRTIKFKPWPSKYPRACDLHP